jgi:hypothetical protein
MPLSPGHDRATVSKNIREMVAAGYPQKQAVAASLDNARRHPRAARRAVGGLAPEYIGNWWEPKPNDPMIEHGLITGQTPGRADRRDFQVPSGAYVIPADIVSGLGEGNTLAGAAKLDGMFANELQNEVPEDDKPGLRLGGIPRMPGAPVPVRLSDGEYVVSPKHVAALGFGNLRHGHNTLDSYIRQMRPEHIKTLKKLPGPVK